MSDSDRRDASSTSSRTWPGLVLLLLSAVSVIVLLGHRTLGSDESEAPIAAAGARLESSARLATGRTADDIGEAHELPLELLQLPDSVESAVLVDVEQNLLSVYGRIGSTVELRDQYYVAIGKAGVGKEREGDERTPLGVYQVASHLPGAELPPIYGSGALTINYPNAWDRRLRRTGSGIWLHGTDKNDRTLLPRSSRGCLTLLNQDFDAVLVAGESGAMPVIIARDLRLVGVAQWRQVRREVNAALEAWRADWTSLDAERYLSHYHADFRSTEGQDLKAWKAHKRRVNGNKEYIAVKLGEVGIFAYPEEHDLFVVTFVQSYRSSNFEAQRRKALFWKKTGDRYQIVHEGSV